MTAKIFSWQYYTHANYGDFILANAVRFLFSTFGRRQYFSVMDGADSRYPIGPRMIEHANKFDAGVIAGGGIIIPRNHELSGWAFRCSTKMIRHLKKTVVFAVGYNLYRNHAGLSPVFKENFEALSENSPFIGLRNTGSIERMKDILDKKYHHKVFLQPCPTTFISRLVDSMDPYAIPQKRKKVALQISLMKADTDVEGVSKEILTVCQGLRNRGFSIDLVSFFNKFDSQIVTYLKNHDFHDFTVVDLDSGGMDVLKGPRYFSDIPITVSTRGHGAMVPLGAGSLFIPINIAPKVVYFANDCGLGDHIVDVDAPDISQSILDKVDHFYASYEELQRSLQEKRNYFYELTLENLSRIYFDITGEHVKERDCMPLNEMEVFLSERLHAKCVKLEGVTRNPDLKKT